MLYVDDGGSLLEFIRCERLSEVLCFIALNNLNCSVYPDVYSYDEDDMVLDSKLPEHLTHFGIDMMTMEKASSLF